MPADRRHPSLSARLALLSTGVLLFFTALSGRAAEPGWIADPANGCRIWNPNPQPNESIIWSGPCPHGVAEGHGTVQWFGVNKSKPVERGSGQFRQGRLWGRGVQTLANGARLSGHWVDNQLSGYGILKIPKGGGYRGFWRNGHWTGFGTRIWANGDRYIGQWRDGKRQGYGIMLWAQSGSRYEGGWDDDAMSGEGTRSWKDGGVYRGAWRDAARSGHGKLIFPDGSTLDGDWVEDKPAGACHIRWTNGVRYDGDCRGFGPDGKGKRVLADGETYDGDWVLGQRSGHGRMVTAAGQTYDGDWRFDKAEGKGVLILPDGARYEGEVVGNIRNGWGVEISAKGERREGYWAGSAFLGEAWFGRGKTLDPQSWPQERSDLAADPAVRFGRLPNGMRYAILGNGTPKDEVSFRLRIEAGSIDERPSQRGLAHFLEHMAFRGSTHIADGEAFRILERLGGQIGADTNAFTTQTQTSFHVDLPHGDRASIDSALTLMRETAGELSITPEAVQSERAVVLAEERTGDIPSLHETREEIAFFYRGQPTGDHMPIGDRAVIAAATPEALRAFYRAYYRPERATLIAVGAIDPVALEKQIQARFADWQSEGPPGIEPDRDPPLPRDPEIHIHSEINSPGRLMVNWVEPFDHVADSRRRQTDAIVDAVTVGAVDHLFEQAAHAPDAPFTGVSLSHALLSNAVRVTSLGIALPDFRRWQIGSAAAFGQLRRLLADGLSQDDIDRQIELMRAAYQQAEAGAATRDSRLLAEALQSSVDFALVFRTPAAEHALFEEAVRDLTPAKATAALRAMVATDGPLFYVASAQPPPDIESALPALWDSAGPDAAGAAVKATPWAYAKFGEPGRVSARSTDPALGVTRATFENGVALTVRSSTVVRDQVLIHARLALPIWSRPSNAIPPYWSCDALMMGGVAKMPYAELADLMRRNGASIACGMSQRGVDLNVTARAAHLDTALQVLTAYLTDPAWRPEALTRVRDQFNTQGTQLDATLQGRLQRESQVLFHNGDLRWAIQPTAREVAGFSLATARDYLTPGLKQAALSVIVTGDVAPDRAIDVVAATLGSLPPRASAAADQPRSVTFPVHDEAPRILAAPPAANNQALALLA